MVTHAKAYDRRLVPARRIAANIAKLPELLVRPAD